MPYELAVVARNDTLRNEPEIRRLEVVSEAPARPGQFYMLRCEHSAVLLPRPISVYHQGAGRLVFIYRRVGAGTEELFRLRAGDRLALQGPLGNGWPIDELRDARVALVGGGVGIPPLRFAAKALAAAGRKPDCYLGYPSRPFLHDSFAGLARRRIIATEDGCVGHRGFVTAPLTARAGDYDAVLCCGPTPMMKAVVELCEAAGTPVWVSLESRMACGVGACLVCACADKSGKNRRSCKDGPVFRGEELDFDA